ncbi:Fungal transcriptional regulatory [Cordyceps militaris]|uniref:Fungal transcriptional regulatory n=1 Tax=Cordyceps militaris TaxID=73501 RepID=A0A2H4STK1_CORMI|nr:Fungal transcriptional regulatory [Cordyceps militaris]
MDTPGQIDADAQSSSGKHPSSNESSPAPSADSSASKRYRATIAAPDCCRTCRLRKVKCTGKSNTGPCTNCVRLELACSFQSTSNAGDSQDRVSRTTPSASHTEAGTLRKRAQRACGQCHSHKTKCSGDLPRCRRCEASNLLCEYTPTKRKFTSVRYNAANGTDGVSTPSETAVSMQSTEEASANSPTTNTLQGYYVMLLDPNVLNAEYVALSTPELPVLVLICICRDKMIKRDILSRHFEVYMHCLYWMPSLGFLHPPTIWRQIDEMTLHPAKAAAICSVTCFFANPGEVGRDFGQRCCNQVEAYLTRSIDRFSEESLMLTTLNTLFNLFLGSYARVWTCLGIGSRIMIGLQANWDSGIYTGRSWVEQESLRRLVWQNFYMDRLLAGGYDEYLANRKDTWKLRLPCKEEAYRGNYAVLVDRLHMNPTVNMDAGLHAWQLRLCDLRHRIQVAAKRLTLPQVNVSRPEPSAVMSEIRALQNELGRFHMSLPKEYKLNDRVIEHIMGTEERNGYIYLHSHIGVSHVDLYRFSLPGVHGTAPDLLQRLPRDFVLASQKQAVGHSISVATFCDAVRREHERHPSLLPIRLTGDYSITHMCTQAIRVLVVALCHNLYHDLAGNTTSPPWRGINSRVVTETDVREMIDSLFKVMEPWSHISRITKQAYDANRTMVDHYYRTGKLNETPNSVLVEATRLSMTSGPNGGSILGSGDLSANEQWSASVNVPSPDDGSLNGAVNLGFEMESGPPGVPLFLEQARMAPLEDIGLGLYDGDNSFENSPLSDFSRDMSRVIQEDERLTPGGEQVIMSERTYSDKDVSAYLRHQQRQVNGYSNKYLNGSSEGSQFLYPGRF